MASRKCMYNNMYRNWRNLFFIMILALFVLTLRSVYRDHTDFINMCQVYAFSLVLVPYWLSIFHIHYEVKLKTVIATIFTQHQQHFLYRNLRLWSQYRIELWMKKYFKLIFYFHLVKMFTFNCK